MVFLKARPWLWYVEVIRGVNVVGLVINEELRKVVWGIIVKNFMQRERGGRERERQRQRDRERQRRTNERTNERNVY